MFRKLHIASLSLFWTDYYSLTSFKYRFYNAVIKECDK